MKNLLSNRFKIIGWILFIPSLILALVYTVLPKMENAITITTYGFFGKAFAPASSTAFRFDEIELMPNLASILLLMGGMFIMFSKEKMEDEYINQIRLHAFQSAVFINYILLFVCIIFIHGVSFFHVMIYNLFTTMLIYIFRFQYLLYQNKNSTNE